MTAPELCETAIHESGHAAAIVYLLKANILHEVSVVPRHGGENYFLGLAIGNSCDWFGDSALYSNGLCTQSLAMKLMVVYYAGGIAQQLYGRGKLKRAVVLFEAFREVASHEGCESDLSVAHKFAAKFKKNSYQGIYLDDKILGDNIDSFLHRAYAKAVDFVSRHKDQILSIFEELLTSANKGTVRGDKIYELLNRKIPEYDYEFESEIETSSSG
jgi:hypothetical protein